MSLCKNLILVISHLFFFMRKNLFSFGFYKSHIKNFLVWNVGHLFARWLVLTSQHIANEIFLDLRPEVFHTGIFDDCYAQLIVLKGHVLLRPDSCIFVLFSRNVGTHELYYILFRNCALLSSFLAFSLCLLYSGYLQLSGILTRTATRNA